MSNKKLTYTMTLMMLIFSICLIFAEYYDGISGSGTALKSQLKTLITSTHDPLGYDTAKLYLFQNVFKNPTLVRCIYTGQDYTIPAGYNGSGSPNCEHSFAQSWFGTTDASIKKADLHHLFPTNSNVNSSRGNLPFAVVANHSSATTYPSFNDFHSYRGSNSSGTTVFEPTDQYKGDVARALLYFSVRYNMSLNIQGVDMLPVFLVWHVQDPVDSFEQTRNTRIQGYQGNRNPFIDHPEWVSAIWQGGSGGTNTQVCFDSDSDAVYESDGTFYINVRILNPSVSNATTCRVNLASGNASKVNGFTNQTITFPANTNTAISIPLTLVDDNAVDGNQTLTFSISNVTGGTNAGSTSPSTFTLVVRDNDFDEGTAGVATDLFISEYVEGSSNNKYLEIFNGTGATVNLNNYQLLSYNNGATDPTYTHALSGTLANNAVIVYRHTSAALTLPAGVTAEVSTACWFGGNDAVVLKKINPSQNIDVIGYVGFDPGEAWISGDHSTGEKTLRRKASVYQGISSPTSNNFPTLVSEWDVYAQNTVSGLGAHNFAYSGSGGGVNGDHQSQMEITADQFDYHFGNATGISMYFNVLEGTSNLKVKRFNSQPVNPSFTGSTPPVIPNYRWTISETRSLISFNITLYIDLDDITNHGILNPNGVKLYHRSIEGQGSFELVGLMGYDTDTHQLYYAGLTSFSEYIIAQDNTTLPVELSSFLAVPNSDMHSVMLNWVTQSENNLLGYYVYRNTSSDLNTALRCSPLIEAVNSSTQHEYSFEDKDLSDSQYYYWLASIERDGTRENFGPISVRLEEDNPETPDLEFTTAFNSIYPNPFNPSTMIAFSLNQPSNVNIKIYNVKGVFIREMNMKELSKGNHQILWDGKDQNQNSCTSGVYFIQMEAGQYLKTRKALLIK